jgi:hypothetical protein
MTALLLIRADISVTVFNYSRLPLIPYPSVTPRGYGLYKSMAFWEVIKNRL